MQYLKVREAALRYQISEKTLRKWITSKQLPHTTRVVNGVSQYALQPKDIETLLAEKSLEPKYPALQEQTGTSGHLDTPSPDTSSLTEQITALAAELSYQSEMIQALQLQVETLSARVLALEQARASPVRSTPASWPVEARVPRKKSDQAPPDLPKGTIHISQLAKELGITLSTFRGHLNNHEWQHIAIEKPNRPGEHTRYFTPEQADVIRQWHAANSSKKTLRDEPSKGSE